MSLVQLRPHGLRLQPSVLLEHAASRQLATRIPSGDPAVAILDKAIQDADEVMAEGRDRVLDLRTPTAVFTDLPQALTALGEEMSVVHNVTSAQLQTARSAR